MDFRKFTTAISGIALLCAVLFTLSGCGNGGGSGTDSQTSATTVTKPTVSPTITTSNAPPGVQSGATGTSGTGAAGTTTSGTDPSSPALVPVVSIDLSPAIATLEVNRQLSFSALAKDASGNSVTVPDANWKWTSSNPAVAVLTSADYHATISAVAPGTATITVVEARSGVTAQASLTVIAAGTGTGSAPGGSGIGGGTTGGGAVNGGPATGGPTATSTLFYANDFNNGAGPGWSNTTVSRTPGTLAYPSTPFLGNATGFGKGTVSLSLASLPIHSSITLEFDLFVILTMDGNNTQPGLGPDVYTVSTDGGITLLNTTFSNLSPPEAVGHPASVYQSFPDAYSSTNTINHIFQTGASRVGQLGYDNGSGLSALHADSVYHLKYTFPHSSSSVKLNFTSEQMQPPTDEGWGLKNVQVTTNP